MICDKVTFKGQVLLTIFHKGFDDNRKYNIKKSEKIGRYNLIFTETFIEDEKVTIENWSLKEEGLIEPGCSKNPYGDAACAYMIHYSYVNKPSSIYTFKDKKYILKVSIDDFLSICEFIKKYTGMDIKSNPMFGGDIFIFECNECNYKHNRSNGIILENVPANSTIIVHFKKSNAIVSSKILKTEFETEKLDISSDELWNSHDIEIFNENELIYYQKDISYMMNISLQLQIKGNGKRVKLNKIGTEYTIENKGFNETSLIGKPIDEYVEILQDSSQKIINDIKLERPDDQVFFIKPGELYKATKLIGQALESAKDELWLFDSYFTDKNGISKILDWLRIIANCSAKSKNIVFYCTDSNSSLNIREIKSEMNKDSILSGILRNQKGVNIHFYQVKSPIHDRFVLIKNNNEYGGISIGTSFNSLERNHYCISKLTHSASKIIFNELISWLRDGNIISEKEV